jgi:hypothetical protein
MLIFYLPTQLMLYAKAIQLIISINIKHKAYYAVVAVRSPKPTVNIIFVPQ